MSKRVKKTQEEVSEIRRQAALKRHQENELWTEEEDLIVLHMYAEDEEGLPGKFPATDVAVALRALGHERSPSAIRARAKKLKNQLVRDFAPKPVSDIEMLANHRPWR